MLRLQDLAPRRYFADGQLEGHRDFVGFGKREAGDLFLTPPDALEPRYAVSRERRVTQGREPCGLQAGSAGAIQARTQQGLQRGRAAHPGLPGQMTPECPRGVGQHTLDVLFIRLTRKRPNDEVEKRLRRDASFEQVVPERYP